MAQFPLNGHVYNDADYNASSNPYGLGAGGFKILFGSAGQFFTDLFADLAINFQMSSTTSVAIGTGSVTMTPAVLRGVPVGSFIQIIKDAGNWMWGQVTAVAATTLTVNVTQVQGGGTYASWTLQPTDPSAPQTKPGYNFAGTKTGTAYVMNADEHVIADCRAGNVTIGAVAAGLTAGVKFKITKVGAFQLTVTGTVRGDASGNTTSDEVTDEFVYVDGTYGFAKAAAA